MSWFSMARAVTTLVACVAAFGSGAALAQELPPPDVKVRGEKEKPKPSPKDKERSEPSRGTRSEGSAVAEAATLLLTSDVKCTVSIDGETVATLPAKGLQKVPVTLGQHVVSAVNEDRTRQWEQIIDAKGKGQIVVKIDFEVASAVASPDEFDKRMALLWVAFSDVKTANDFAKGILSKSFGFHDPSVSTAIHTAHQGFKRAGEELKEITAKDPARRLIIEDVARSQGAIDKYVESVTKAIAAAQSSNSWMGEPNNLYAQAVAMLPGAEWTRETLNLLRQSPAFKMALPPDYRARLGLSPETVDFELGTDSLSVDPMQMLVVRKGGVAEAMGIKPGDRIISVAGQTPATLWDFKEAVRANSGKKIRLTIEREGKRQDREAKVPLLPAATAR